MTPLSVFVRRILRKLGFRRRSLSRVDHHWRRKLILTTRKLQHVQLLFQRDLAEMRERAIAPAAAAAGKSSPGIELRELALTRETVEVLLQKVNKQGEALAALAENSSGAEAGRLFDELKLLQEQEVLLRKRVEEMEEARAYLEAQHVHQLGGIRSGYKRRITDLEAQVAALSEGAETPLPAKSGPPGSDPRLAAVEAKLKERERALAEMNGRHMQQMSHFADESGEHIKQAQVATRAERARADEMAARCSELELQIDELKQATWEIFQLQGESSPEDLQSGISRIAELMQVVDDPGPVKEKEPGPREPLQP